MGCGSSSLRGTTENGTTSLSSQPSRVKSFDKSPSNKEPPVYSATMMTSDSLSVPSSTSEPHRHSRFSTFPKPKRPPPNEEELKQVLGMDSAELMKWGERKERQAAVNGHMQGNAQSHAQSQMLATSQVAWLTGDIPEGLDIRE